MTMSGNSVITAFAAAFMRSIARRSFGFSKEYLFENLSESIICRVGLVSPVQAWVWPTYLWKPRPSMRMTIQVFGIRRSGCSKSFTYSYLQELAHTDLNRYIKCLLGISHFRPLIANGFVESFKWGWIKDGRNSKRASSPQDFAGRLSVQPKEVHPRGRRHSLNEQRKVYYLA